MSKAVTDYWHKHYPSTDTEVPHRSLCGNHGILDTRATAVTPAGVWCGRLNFCICPNGQALRRLGADIERQYLHSQGRRIT